MAEAACLFVVVEAAVGAAQSKLKAFDKSLKDTAKGAEGLETALRKTTKAGDVYQDAQGRWREANGRFVSSARQAELGLNNQTKATDRTSNAFKRGKRAALGFVSTLAGPLSVAYGVKLAADAAVGFEKRMSTVRAVSGANARQMRQLSQTALDLGSKTGLGARKAAEGLTELVKGGIKVKQAGKALKGTLDLARAGSMEVADAAAATANALNLFGLKGRDATHVADALARAANDTTADVADFAMALSQGGGAAKAAGLSFNDTIVALEALAKSGVKNSDAGTSLKTALIQLASPTKQAQEVMDKLGLSFFNSNGKMKSMTQVAGMLRDKMSGLTQEQRLAALQTIAGTDGFRALLALYDQGPDKVKRYGDALKKQGDAAKVAKTQQDNMAGGFARVRAALESLVASGGQGGLAKSIKNASFDVANFIDQLRTGKGAGGEFAGSIGRAFDSIKRRIDDAKSAFDGLGGGGGKGGGPKQIAGDFKTIGDTIAKVIDEAGGLKQAFRAPAGHIQHLTGNVHALASLFRGDLRGAIDGAKQGLGGFVKVQFAPVIGGVNLIKKALGGAGDQAVAATGKVNALGSAIANLKGKDIRINVYETKYGNKIGSVGPEDVLTPRPGGRGNPGGGGGSGRPSGGGGGFANSATARTSAAKPSDWRGLQVFGGSGGKSKSKANPYAKPRKKGDVSGINPFNGRKEYHSPKRWHEVRVNYQRWKKRQDKLPRVESIDNPDAIDQLEPGSNVPGGLGGVDLPSFTAGGQTDQALNDNTEALRALEERLAIQTELTERAIRAANSSQAEVAAMGKYIVGLVSGQIGGQQGRRRGTPRPLALARP